MFRGNNLIFRVSLLTTLTSFALIIADIALTMLVGEESLYLMHISYFLFIFIILLDSTHSWGLTETLLFFITSFLIGFFFEVLGVFYGIPFGKYHYTDLIPLKIFGVVPWSVPVYWFIITYVSFNIVGYLTDFRFLKGNRAIYIPLTSILDGLCAVSWDLLMDPVMVNVVHLWVWESQGFYFGVPLSNFIGWVVVVFIITAFYKILVVKSNYDAVNSTYIPLIIYFELWLVMAIISIRSGNISFLPIGSFSMSTFIFLYAFKYFKNRSPTSIWVNFRGNRLRVNGVD